MDGTTSPWSRRSPHPQRSLPIALIAGLAIVGVLYMATNAAIQYILTAAQIAASPRPAVDALAAITGPWGAAFVSAVMAFSIFVTLNGTVMSGARVSFAAARDGLFFRRMAASTRASRVLPPHSSCRRSSPRTAACRRTLPAIIRIGHLLRMALLHDHVNDDLHYAAPSPQPPTAPGDTHVVRSLFAVTIPTSRT